MKKEELKPQISQMNADVLLDAFVCAILRHLRLSHPGNAQRERLEKVGI